MAQLGALEGLEGAGAVRRAVEQVGHLGGGGAQLRWGEGDFHESRAVAYRHVPASGRSSTGIVMRSGRGCSPCSRFQWAIIRAVVTMSWSFTVYGEPLGRCGTGSSARRRPLPPGTGRGAGGDSGGRGPHGRGVLRGLRCVRGAGRWGGRGVVLSAVALRCGGEDAEAGGAVQGGVVDREDQGGARARRREGDRFQADGWGCGQGRGVGEGAGAGVFEGVLGGGGKVTTSMSGAGVSSHS